MISEENSEEYIVWKEGKIPELAPSLQKQLGFSYQQAEIQLQTSTPIWKMICDWVKGWRVKKLKIITPQGQHLPLENLQIAQALAQTDFLVLKKLSLGLIGLTSLEFLGSIYAPNLSTLIFDNNQICRIKSIRKLICPLTYIGIAGNPVLDFPFMSQCFFAQRISFFILRFGFEQYSIDPDIRQMCKLQIRSFDCFLLNSHTGRGKPPSPKCVLDYLNAKRAFRLYSQYQTL